MTDRLRKLARRALCAALIAFAPGCDDARPADPAAPQKQTADTPPPQQSAEAKQALATLSDPSAETADLLKSIHFARENRLKPAIPDLRRILKGENSTLIVAAAAALGRLDAAHADTDVIDAAERFSRDGHFEYLRQILYIIGNIGGPRAEIYLETVAEAHQVPPIRATAEEILKDMDPASPL